MSTAPSETRYDQAAIEPDPAVPAIHIWRDFAGTPDQLRELAPSGVEIVEMEPGETVEV